MEPDRGILAALSGHDAADALRDLDARGALTEAIPELEAARGFEQPALHHYDVLGHSIATVAAFDEATGAGSRGQYLRETTDWFDLGASLATSVDGVPLMTLLRLACLVHDVAKPATATMMDGRLRFPRHGQEGERMMRARLPELGLGPDATDLVARLIREHLRPAELVRNHPATDRAFRKLSADARGHVAGLMLLHLSDGWGTRGPGYTWEQFERHCTFLNYVVARAWLVTRPGPAPLVNGEDLMREPGMDSGRLLGAVLTSIHRAQLAGDITSRDEALAMARDAMHHLAGTGSTAATKE